MVDTFGIQGATIRTVSGKYVNFIEPDSATITIHDVAHALSKICRYNGHVRRFYSVADHCIYCVKMAVHDGIVDKRLLQTILLHDAAEAYIGDVVKPLKNLLPQYREIEKRLENVIEKAFDIDLSEYFDCWTFYDRTALKTEKVTFFPDDPHEWTGLELYPVHAVKPIHFLGRGQSDTADTFVEFYSAFCEGTNLDAEDVRYIRECK